MKTICIRFLASALIAGFSSPTWAVLIVGTNDPVNNTATFTHTVAPTLLTVNLENTSNFDARITGFGFNVSSGSFNGGLTVSGTLNNAGWAFSFDAIPSPTDDRDAFAITGANLNGGDPVDGIAVGGTGIFGFSGVFSDLNLSVSDIIVRFQQTGASGEGSDRGFACTQDCEPPTTSVPEPSSLGLLGLGIAVLGFVSSRRRVASRQ